MLASDIAALAASVPASWEFGFSLYPTPILVAITYASFLGDSMNFDYQVIYYTILAITSPKILGG
jgi:hypothetical protein